MRVEEFLRGVFPRDPDRAAKAIEWALGQHAETVDDLRGIPPIHWTLLPGVLAGRIERALGETDAPHPFPPGEPPRSRKGLPESPRTADLIENRGRKLPAPRENRVRFEELWGLVFARAGSDGQREEFVSVAPASLRDGDGDLKFLRARTGNRAPLFALTRDWAEIGAPEPVGYLVGPEWSVVTLLSDYFRKELSLDPFDGSVLFREYNSTTGLDWNGVDEDLRVFAAWLFSKEVSSSYHPTDRLEFVNSLKTFRLDSSKSYDAAARFRAVANAYPVAHGFVRTVMNSPGKYAAARAKLYRLVP